jgi:hypothetical protein
MLRPWLMARTLRSRLSPCCVVLGFSFALAAVAVAGDVQVAIVRAAEWDPGDAAREGAGEFLILLRAAQLQRTAGAAALVALADQPGALRAGSERALRRVALTGVVMAKIARNGDVPWTPDQLYVDGGDASAERAQRILMRGLELFGAAPKALDPDHPTPPEITAVHEHLRKFQALFARETHLQVARR